MSSRLSKSLVPEDALSKNPENLREYFERAIYIFDPSTALPETLSDAATEIVNLKKSIKNLALTGLKLLDYTEKFQKELREKNEKQNTGSEKNTATPS